MLEVHLQEADVRLPIHVSLLPWFMVLILLPFTRTVSPTRGIKGRGMNLFLSGLGLGFGAFKSPYSTIEERKEWHFVLWILHFLFLVNFAPFRAGRFQPTSEQGNSIPVFKIKDYLS